MHYHTPQANGAPLRLLLTSREAAEALAISPRSLWSLTNSGELPCVRMGRSVRYAPEDLQEWIDRQRQPGAG